LFSFYTKLGDDNCSFQIELNFLIKVCLVLCLKNALKKKLNFFLLFSLFQINIFDVLYFLKKYIEIGSDIKLGLAEA
jgi:hypothetical protein